MSHATLKANRRELEQARRGLPPGTWRRAGELVLIATLGVAIYAGSTVLRDPQRFPIRAVRVEGDMSRQPGEAFSAALRSAAATGLFGLDVKALKRTLVADPWVADVTIRRVWPDTLAVRVTEHVPVARWNEGGAVSSKGALFEPPAGELSEQLLHLEGPAGELPRVLMGLEQARAVLDPLGLAVVAFGLDDQRSWRITLSGGQQLLIGRQDLEERLLRFALGYRVYLQDNWRAIRRVDLRYPNGFAVATLDDKNLKDPS